MLENSVVVVVPVIALSILSLEPWVRLVFDHDFQDRPEKLIHIKNKTPPHLKQYIKTYDLRKNKGQYDDIVFTIDKVSR